MNWATAHFNRWNDAPAKVGFDVLETEELLAQLAAVVAAYNEQLAQAESAKAATAAADALFAKLDDTVSASVSSIRGFAKTRPDPAIVLADAELPVRKAPTPSPVPAAPSALKTSLDASGAVSLTWISKGGFQSFLVRRQLTPVGSEPGNWEPMAHDGSKPFVDVTVPAATRQVSYQVRATRAGKASGWSEASTLLYVAGDAAPAQLRIAA